MEGSIRSNHPQASRVTMVKRALCVMLIGSLKFSEPTDVDVLEE